MLQIQKPAGAETWAGVTIAQEYAGSDLTADGNVCVTMVVNAPDAGVLTLKLETSDPAVNVEIPQNVERVGRSCRLMSRLRLLVL